MTPGELSQILLRDEYHVIDISPEDFAKLELQIGTRAYTYRPKIGELRIKMATQMHATVSMWAAELIAEGEALGAWNRRDIQFLSEGRLKGFTAEYQGITKVPDCEIVPRGRFWPTIVFEFGYAEPYDHLKDDVKLLLEGSGGKISKAIIIKIQPLREGQTEMQSGFVEMWHLSGGIAKKDGGRESLFPPPRSHATQKLEMTLRDILRSQFANLRNAGWGEDHIVTLLFDPLRTWIEDATWRHLIQEGVLEEDDESA